MPYQRPTLTQLRADIASDMEAAQPGADALLRFGNLKILGAVLAAAVNGHYGYLDWIARMAVPFTAEGEFLEAWAALKGVVRKGATQAAGTATFTGENGNVLPAGSPVVRGDGAAYVVAADGTVSGGSVTVALTASVAGAAGNADAGTALTLSTPVSGLNSSGVAATDFIGGADIEDDDSFRSRMLQVYAAPPQGGAADDYVEWALEVPGVTRAWTTRLGMGPGTVVVHFMMDDVEAANDGFPQGDDGVAADEDRDVPATGEQLLVADYIYPKQPVTALVYVAAPLPNTVTFEIAGIVGASTAVKNAIQAAIEGVFKEEGAPGGKVNLSDIEAAIGAVSGSAGFVVSDVGCNHGTVTPSSSGNITSDAGYIPVRGAVTWVA